MSQHLEIDVSGAPETRFRFRRLLNSAGLAFLVQLGATLVWAITVAARQSDAEAAIVPILDISVFEFTIYAWSLVFPVSFLILQFGSNTKFWSMRIPHYELSLGQLKKRLAPLRGKSVAFRIVWPLANVAAAVAVVVLANASFPAAANIACEGIGHYSDQRFIVVDRRQYDLPIEQYPAEDSISCVNGHVYNYTRETERGSSILLLSLLAIPFAVNAFRLWSYKAGLVRTLTSYATILVIWVTVGLTPIAIFGLLKERFPSSDWIPLAPMLLYPICGPIALRWTRRIASFAEPGAADIRARDSRPPILFLRSFDDESLPIGARTLEESLSDALRPFGPFIAIGKPGELRPSGAAREYYSGDAWRPSVLNLMDHSAVIVTTAGATPGLEWEVARLRSLSRLRKTIFLLPTNAQRRADRIVKLRELLDPTPEGALFKYINPTNAIIAHYSERRGWLIINTSSWKTSEGEIQAAIDVALYGILVDCNPAANAKASSNI